MIKFLKYILIILVMFFVVDQAHAINYLTKTNEELISSLEVKVSYENNIHNLIPSSTILYEDNEKTYLDSAGSTVILDSNSPTKTTYSLSVFLNPTTLGSIKAITTDYSKIRVYFKAGCSVISKDTTVDLLNSGQLNIELNDVFTNLNNCVEQTFQDGGAFQDKLGGALDISVSLIDNKGIEYLALGTRKQFRFTILPKILLTECNIEFSGLEQNCNQVDPQTGQRICVEGATVNSDITVEVKGISSQGYRAVIYQNNSILDGGSCDAIIKENCIYRGITEPDYSKNIGNLEPGVYEYAIRYNPEWKSALLQVRSDKDLYLCRRTLTVVGFGEELVAPGENATGKDLIEMEFETNPSIPLCDSITDPDMKAKCKACEGSSEVTSGVWTGIGCMPTNFSGIVSSLFTLFSGLMGGFVFLCLVSNGLKIMASRGNPEALKKGQEAITACLVGFVVLVLSILFLKIVGVDILDLPEWN